MAEWTHAEICTLIDERRTRNDEFHNLGRNQERFWGTIASARYFDEFRTHFWERSEDEFDRVRRINTFNRKRSRGSGYITPIPSTRDLERELRSSERRRRQSLPVRERRSELPPVSSLTTNDEMDISDTEQLVGQRRTSTHEELLLSLHPPPSYDIATAQESSNVRGNVQ
ncbi:hypothetical protein RhiirA4_409181 [Rhizophagus irregularis]|uniref:Uncharacterized protein n=1 Tax=Rhizophagus irregularis TaxID=588596 RepID=A0A2I1H425_9GLOM|nr:hypothetical protein RhiirA4_409181 [Rhizophagus irregularis]